MINKGAKGNIIIKTQQLPYSILWDSLDPAILDTYHVPNQITLDNSHNWMLQEQIRPITVHMYKNIPHFTDLCLRHLLSLEAQSFVALPMKTLGIFVVTDITISYSNKVYLLERTT